MLDSEPDSTQQEMSRPYEKWGQAAITGWQPVPDMLLKHQKEIGLSATDIVVALNVLSYWWYKDQLPFVRVSTIANRMDVSKRTVQRSLQNLVNLKLFERRREKRPNGDEVEAIDPRGLVRKLSTFAINDRDYQVRERKRVGRLVEA